jgi:tRNA/rRNA methyltransferase
MSGPAFVLVQPSLAENVGAAARVMANFGLSELRLVGPGFAEDTRARALAAGGSSVLDGATVHASLAEALADRGRVYATTALDKALPLPVVTPRALGAALREDARRGVPSAVVFGTERTGLSLEELAHAHVLVRIPTDPACRALNLAQAVAVCAWEWCAAEAPTELRPAPPPASASAVDGAVRQITDALDRVGGLTEPALRRRLLRSLRVALGRGLTEPELRTLRGVIVALERGARTGGPLGVSPRDDASS